MNPADRFSLTHYGHKIYFGNLYRSVFDIRDIAHNLAVVPRWSGSTDWEDFSEHPYSVAQHLLWCYHYVMTAGGTENEAKAALLHDAEEFILGDLSSPAKVFCEDYRKLGDEIRSCIFYECNLPLLWATDLPSIVKAADSDALIYEAEMLCHYDMQSYVPGPPRMFDLSLYDLIAPQRPSIVKKTFLSIYQSLSQ